MFQKIYDWLYGSDEITHWGHGIQGFFIDLLTLGVFAGLGNMKIGLAYGVGMWTVFWIFTHREGSDILGARRSLGSWKEAMHKKGEDGFGDWYWPVVGATAANILVAIWRLFL